MKRTSSWSRREDVPADPIKENKGRAFHVFWLEFVSIAKRRIRIAKGNTGLLLLLQVRVLRTGKRERITLQI